MILVVAVWAHTPVARPKENPCFPSHFTESDDPCFTGAPGLVRSDSAPATVPAPTQRPASLLTKAQQINLRALLSGPASRPRPSALEGPDSTQPPRTMPRIDKAVAARLARPHLPRAAEIPEVTAPPSAGPMATQPVPPLPPPSPRHPAEEGPEVPSPPGARTFSRREPGASPGGCGDRHAWATPCPK
jgi:hypothetical protein